MRKFAYTQAKNNQTIRQTVQRLRPLQSSVDTWGSGPITVLYCTLLKEEKIRKFADKEQRTIKQASKQAVQRLRPL